MDVHWDITPPLLLMTDLPWKLYSKCDQISVSPKSYFDNPTLKTSFHYRSQTNLREGNVFTPVCLTFCSQGGCLPLSLGGVCLWVREGRSRGVSDTPRQTPRGRHPQVDTRTSPPQADTLKRRPLKRAVRILLGCILVLWNLRQPPGDWSSSSDRTGSSIPLFVSNFIRCSA